MLKCIALCLNIETARAVAKAIEERFDIPSTQTGVNTKGHCFVECYGEAEFHQYVLCANMFLRGMEYALRSEAEKLRAERLERING